MLSIVPPTPTVVPLYCTYIAGENCVPPACVGKFNIADLLISPLTPTAAPQSSANPTILLVSRKPHQPQNEVVARGTPKKYRERCCQKGLPHSTYPHQPPPPPPHPTVTCKSRVWGIIHSRDNLHAPCPVQVDRSKTEANTMTDLATRPLRFTSAVWLFLCRLFILHQHLRLGGQQRRELGVVHGLEREKNNKRMEEGCQ